MGWLGWALMVFAASSAAWSGTLRHEVAAWRVTHEARRDAAPAPVPTLRDVPLAVTLPLTVLKYPPG